MILPIFITKIQCVQLYAQLLGLDGLKKNDLGICPRVFRSGWIFTMSITRAWFSTNQIEKRAGTS